MKKKIVWIVLPLVAIFIFSSCATNLFSNLELDRLLTSGSIEERLNAAQQALSGKNYDAAMILSASVLNELLGLDLTVQELKNLLNEEVLNEFTNALANLQDELSQDELSALSIMIEAVVVKSGKSIVEIAEELSEILEELGFQLPSKGEVYVSLEDEQDNLWEILKGKLPEIAQLLAKVFDNRPVLKFLTIAYHHLATVSEEPVNKFYAALGTWYDIGFMLNLVLDSDDDGDISDEQFIKDVVQIEDPNDLEALLEDTESGLYQNEHDSNEFMWGYEKIEEFLQIIGVEIDLPPIDVEILPQKETLKDLFEYLISPEF